MRVLLLACLTVATADAANWRIIGTHTLANAVVLCPNCHRVRHEAEHAS